MPPTFYSAERDPSKCVLCGVCENIIQCARLSCQSYDACTGCGACSLVCPNEAVHMVERSEPRHITVSVDSEVVSIPERITVKKALEWLGYTVTKIPTEGAIFAPCEVGGCYSCAVYIDGTLQPSCITPVGEGMEIVTKLPLSSTPLRRVHGWMGHGVGGVGTPWYLKGGRHYIEAAVFACGCNLRCPQCQNWTTTYNGVEQPQTPTVAATTMTQIRKKYGIDRMAISGGESTLNRPWLVAYIQELRRLNPDSSARFHIDTNATILTRSYIDELVAAGMTDIGPDLKGLHVETFMSMTGLQDRKLAEHYLRSAWESVEYLIDTYKDKVFIGVGIPYNKALITKDEIAEIGEKLYRIDSEIQVCVLDYRPEFRRPSLQRPTRLEMGEIWKLLDGIGLTTVICQTSSGHIGPKMNLSTAFFT